MAKHETRLREDLGEVVRMVNQHGPRSEEVREYVQRTAETYDDNEFVELSATFIFVYESNERGELD
jgi:hypothetical protein